MFSFIFFSMFSLFRRQMFLITCFVFSIFHLSFVILFFFQDFSQVFHFFVILSNNGSLGLKSDEGCSEVNRLKVERVLYFGCYSLKVCFLRCLLFLFGTCHVSLRFHVLVLVCFNVVFVASTHVSWWCSTRAWLHMVWTVHSCRWTLEQCTLGHRNSPATAKKSKSFYVIFGKVVKYRSRSARFFDLARVT